ncbi:MAG: hypothetical protein KAI86_02985 [Desulfobacterales bacterium]|nr:hypothetical protein [Desulfobacterales bacterium]
MTETFINGTVEEFELPSTLICRVGLKADGGFGISPGHLTEAQASEYWDNMRESWIKHCAKLRVEANEWVEQQALGRVRSV